MGSDLTIQTTNLEKMNHPSRFRNLIHGRVWQKDGVEVLISSEKSAWPDTFFERAEAHWQEALKNNKRLFNGKLSSLESTRIENDKLILTLGEICYRDQLFSNSRIKFWQPDKREKYAARGLGISAIVITADQDVLMIVRSKLVSDHSGFLDVLGGHIDPQKHARSEMAPDVFYAIEDEIHCELGVAFDSIERTVCTGLIENSEWLKPELVFVANLNVTKAAVLAGAKKAEEGYEYSAIQSFPADLAGVSTFLEKNAHRCTPSAEGSLRLFAEFLQKL